ncbi:NADPH oxidoreductase A-like [Diadema setosum]|uniref:NADPH oxidoreductase A-like n=1 Tax=Diadema setosum TaxID=31175 RepID=UPI003B3AEF2D
MFVAAVIVILSVFLWIYASNILKPSKKHGTSVYNFSSFIDDTDSGSPCSNNDDQVEASPSDRYSPLYNDPGRQLLILYGTEYGFSEEVARTLFDRQVHMLEQVREDQYPDLQPRLLNAAHHQYLRLDEEQLVLVIISTSGDGVPPSSAVAWYSSFMSCPDSLAHLRFSVLALGDSNYPHFCRAGRTVCDRFLKRGARPLVSKMEVDAEDWTVINSWMNAVSSAITSDDFSLEERLDYLSPLITHCTTEDGFSRLKPFMATLKVKKQLTECSEMGDKETIHCEFNIEGSSLCYTSGDAVGIYPTNRPEDVDMVLSVSGLNGDSICTVPASAYHPHPENEISLRQCLLKYYDLKNIRVSLLETLLKFSVDEVKTRLQVLLKDGTSRSNKKLMDYLEGVELADVLEDFPVKMATGDLLRNLRPLQPRYYSISSSPVVDPSNVCVTAAVVRYSSRGRARVGVTTTFLQDRLRVGDVCPVFLSPNPDFRLPKDPSRDIIMVGPGTGIAPFRAFIQERVATNASGKNLLYFGCRHKEQDFLYRNELETLVDSGQLVLRTAFSRDQEQKEYVQHLIGQDGHMIWEMLEGGAHVYVCGDARSMAPDVHRALATLIQTRGQMTEREAMKYIQCLEEEHRYQKDVWVT